MVGGGGAPFQNFRQDGQLFQVGASILHVPSGLFAYGLYQNDQEDGTQIRDVAFHKGVALSAKDSAANEIHYLVRESRYQEGLVADGCLGVLGRVGPV